MGIVKISDQMHENLRVAGTALSRSINAQAEHWMRVGMLTEMHPDLDYRAIYQLLIQAELSGGLDSTAIVAVAKACGFDRLKTLCISFDDPAYNEGPLASETAERFGTEHFDWRMTVAEGRKLLSDFLNHIDRPSNDGFNTYCVARFAHEQGITAKRLVPDDLFPAEVRASVRV